MLRNSVSIQPASTTTVTASGNTTLLTVNTQGLERIFVYVSVATQALDGFLIDVSPDDNRQSSTTWVNLYSTAADYTSPSGLLIGTSGDLTSISASGTGWFMMDVSGICQLRVRVSAASDSAVVTLIASGGGS